MNKTIYLIVIFILTFSCSTMIDKRLSKVSRWGYQLQNYKPPYDLSRISSTKNMLWVIDSETDSGKINHSKVNILKQNSNTIVSYFSIGEAESYRDYYKEMPKDLIIEENKNWAGNFRVKYWSPIWHQIMLAKLDQIIDSGFDGVYLDIVDAYDYYEPLELKRKRAEQMLQFVTLLHKHAIERDPNFIFIQQNGASIISLLEKPSHWIELIAAIAIESMFFSGEKPMNNALNLDQSIVKYLSFYQEKSLPIFSIEYIDEGPLIEQYKNISKKYRVIPLAASKELDGSMISPF